MNCLSSFECTVIPGTPLPEVRLEGVLDQRTRNRQSAAAYLQAAARTDDALARAALRRQAAELILPRRARGGGF